MAFRINCYGYWKMIYGKGNDIPKRGGEGIVGTDGQLSRNMTKKTGAYVKVQEMWYKARK